MLQSTVVDALQGVGCRFIGLLGYLFLDYDFGLYYLLIWKTSSVEGLNSNLYFISLLKMGIL